MLGNISPLSLLLILLIVVVLFGTKRLRNIGGDLGAAVKNFRKGMTEAETEAEDTTPPNEKSATKLERKDS